VRFFTPLKSGDGKWNAWVVISSSAYDRISDILFFARDCWANWEIPHIFSTYILWAGAAPQNFGITYNRRRRSHSVCYAWAHCFVSELECLKSQNEATFLNIWPPSKNSRGAGKLCEIKPRSVIVAIVRCLRFPIFCSVLKPELVKCDWCRKWRQNFALFDPRIKFRGELGKISELILPVLPRTKPQIYFWRGAAWPSRKWESGHGCQNRKDAKREILQAIVGWP